MFKFRLGQEIFYIRDNRLHSAPVMSRRCVENSRECKSGGSNLYSRFGHSGIEYSTVHGIIKEKEAFASKEDLAASLIA